MGDAALLSYCSLLRNPRQKPTDVLERCCEGEINCWFSIFGGCFLLTASIRQQRMSLYISLFTVAISVNYTSKLWELSEAATYVLLHIMYRKIHR
jgi:hypothetical protein